MQVDVLNHTENPERTVCAAARGDEMEMSMVGIDLTDEDDYAEVMESVPYDEDDVEAVVPKVGNIPVSGTVRDGTEHANNAKTRALIHRLIRTYGHYGPFEHTNITFAAEGVSIVVERQITRHRHVTWDVQSLRCVELEDSDVVTPESMQGVGRFNMPIDTPADIDAAHAYQHEADQAFKLYQQMVDEGVPKEDARYILPLGTPINMTFTMNLRTLMHVVDMRDAANVQPETIEFAEKLLDAAEDVNTIETYREYAKGRSKKSP